MNTVERNEIEALRSNWLHKAFQVMLATVIGMLLVCSVESRGHDLSVSTSRMLRGLNVFVPESIPVFFINLEKSKERRSFIENELTQRNLKFKRVEAVTSVEAQSVRIDVQTVVPPTPHEVACISSHLLAMYEAINDQTLDPENPYALIMEDDVALHFDVNFSELIAQAPVDFGILQLTTSNDYEAKRMWEEFKTAAISKSGVINTEDTWRRHKLSDGLWSTQAYIIRKAAVRAFIEKTVKVDTDAGGKKSSFRLVPTKATQCQRLPGFNGALPCLQQFRMVADMYLYAAFAPVYTLRVPIFNGAGVGSVSTIPTHKAKDAGAAVVFKNIGEIIADVKVAKDLLPSYISPLSSSMSMNSPPGLVLNSLQLASKELISNVEKLVAPKL